MSQKNYILWQHQVVLFHDILLSIHQNTYVANFTEIFAEPGHIMEHQIGIIV